MTDKQIADALRQKYRKPVAIVAPHTFRIGHGLPGDKVLKWAP